jgi:DNA helicase-2/ATP-dependent DNA helicase PcrA
MFDAEGWDAGLDDAQLEAVLHDDGPLVVAAGAGTGKTRTLTARVARLLERGTAPERILLLTFTRRAADDMLARAAFLSGHTRDARRLRGGTFHAVAHQLICTCAEPLGLPIGFSVLDPADAADLMDLLREEHRLTGNEVRMPRPATLVDIYSRCVNTQRPIREVLAVDFPWCEPHAEGIAELCKSYVTRKRKHGQLDFDDLLLYWRAALADKHLGTHMSELFDFVLVDEYQDVNALQVDIIRSLCPQGRGLTVVGDDAQAVYGFRGADARHLTELAATLPGSTMVKLETNFRSFQPILDLANVVRPTQTGVELVLHGSRRGGRRPVLLRCHDAPGEARAVAERILTAHEQGRALRDQAILVRAAHHSDLIELELSARRIPYRKYGGLRFIETAHVKDFVAAVRLLDNPSDDIAWFRLLRLHDGVGPARAKAMLAALHPQDPTAGHAWSAAVAAAPATARVALTDTFNALTVARSLPGAKGRPGAVLAMLGPLVENHYTDAQVRLGDLERLASAAETAEDLGAWLAEVTLDPPVSTGDLAGPPHLDEDYVVISTVHSAKGLEWPVVHIPHLVDGAFPSDMALGSAAGLAEERRLFYVATTRARDQLILYVPLRMPHRRRALDDRHSLAPASRFLDEAALGMLDIEEQTPDRPKAPAYSGSARVTVELDGLWR